MGDQPEMPTQPTAVTRRPHAKRRLGVETVAAAAVVAAAIACAVWQQQKNAALCSAACASFALLLFEAISIWRDRQKQRSPLHQRFPAFVGSILCIYTVWSVILWPPLQLVCTLVVLVMYARFLLWSVALRAAASNGSARTLDDVLERSRIASYTDTITRALAVLSVLALMAFSLVLLRHGDTEITELVMHGPPATAAPPPPRDPAGTSGPPPNPSSSIPPSTSATSTSATTASVSTTTAPAIQCGVEIGEGASPQIAHDMQSAYYTYGLYLLSCVTQASSVDGLTIQPTTSGGDVEGWEPGFGPDLPDQLPKRAAALRPEEMEPIRHWFEQVHASGAQPDTRDVSGYLRSLGYPTSERECGSGSVRFFVDVYGVVTAAVVRPPGAQYTLFVPPELIGNWLSASKPRLLVPTDDPALHGTDIEQLVGTDTDVKSIHGVQGVASRSGSSPTSVLRKCA